MLSPRGPRVNLEQMDRAEEKAGPEDVGEQTLMRGLDTAFPFFVWGRHRSRDGHRSDDRPHRLVGNSAAVVPPSRLHDRCLTRLSLLRLVATTGCGPLKRFSQIERSTAPGRRYACRALMTSLL